MQEEKYDERTAQAIAEADTKIGRALGIRPEADLNRKQLRQQRAKMRPFKRKLEKLKQEQARIQAKIDAAT